MSDDNPSPNSVSASPVATWFDLRYWVMSPKSRLSPAPASAAATKPTAGLPVLIPTANPTTAPVIIIPSTPRFSTPARSTTAPMMIALKTRSCRRPASSAT